MKRVASLACALSVLLAPHAGAQGGEAVQGLSTDVVRTVFAVPAPAPLAPGAPYFAPAAPEPAPLAAPAPAPTLPQGARPFGRSVLHTLGGAVVGAWLGLVTSQVVKSDWEKASNQEVLGHRAGFALGGALFGGAGGMLIATRPSSELAVSLRQARRQEQEVITLEEIQTAGMANVYEVVQSLHPEWLRTRGIKSRSEVASIEGGPGGTTFTPGLPTIIAYLDDSRLGGVEALRQIATADAGAVQFLTAAQATYKWGIGHHHGAIWVTTRK